MHTTHASVPQAPNRHPLTCLSASHGGHASNASLRSDAVGWAVQQQASKWPGDLQSRVANTNTCMSYADQLDSWTGLCGVRHKAGRHRLVHIGPVHLADLPPQGPNGWLPCVALWSTRTSSAQLSAALSEACRTPPQPPMTSLLVMCFGVPAQSPPHASPFLQPQKFGLPVLTFGVPSLGSLYPQPSLPFPVPPHPNSNSWLADFDPAAYPPPPPSQHTHPQQRSGTPAGSCCPRQHA